mmetsp:Transcript_11021/g.28023  ORF Transcript_11021/g.28023 Transcript_11021/m.28023 type:complete len:204 (+) Transcript_11021:97-708(+)
MPSGPSSSRTAAPRPFTNSPLPSSHLGSTTTTPSSRASTGSSSRAFRRKMPSTANSTSRGSSSSVSNASATRTNSNSPRAGAPSAVHSALAANPWPPAQKPPVRTPPAPAAVTPGAAVAAAPRPRPSPRISTTIKPAPRGSPTTRRSSTEWGLARPSCACSGGAVIQKKTDGPAAAFKLSPRKSSRLSFLRAVVFFTNHTRRR